MSRWHRDNPEEAYGDDLRDDKSERRAQAAEATIERVKEWKAKP